MIERRVFLLGGAGFASLALIGCDRAGATGAAPPPSASAAAPASERGFYGKIVPRSATPLHAPPGFFQIKGWTSRRGWVKLEHVEPDGTKVEAGKEIARFEFGNEEAVPWIKQRVAETDADRKNTGARTREETRRLQGDAEKLRLAERSAELDTGKRGMVSERDLKLLELAHERAMAEAASAGSKANAANGKAAAEMALVEAKAGEWSLATERYAMYEKRVHIIAPHDGWVRYAYLNHSRRKVQKPDNMPSGTPFVYIAKDQSLDVEIFVPEHRISAMSPGTKVKLRLPDDERRVEATVVQIEAFPQEIGFLRGDDELPDAREKAFSVRAEITDPPSFLSSGIEVRVEP
jgi:hypothetical protein